MSVPSTFAVMVSLTISIFFGKDAKSLKRQDKGSQWPCGLVKVRKREALPAYVKERFKCIRNSLRLS